MRKDELVHLHSLLTLIRAEYERRGIASPEAFADYEALDVSPMAVYGPKGEHADAVQALADPLASQSESALSASTPVPDSRDGKAGHREQNVSAQP